jgi:hypothetical protein
MSNIPEACPQARSINPDYGSDSRIEFLVPSVKLDSNGHLFQRLARRRQSVFDDELQKTPHSLSVRKSNACKHLAKLRSDRALRLRPHKWCQFTARIAFEFF